MHECQASKIHLQLLNHNAAAASPSDPTSCLPTFFDMLHALPSTSFFFKLQNGFVSSCFAQFEKALIDVHSNIHFLPFRRTHRVSLSASIRQYISTKYDQHPDMFIRDMEAIDKLRADAVNTLEAHTSGIRKLTAYAAQLVWIGGKFPIDVSKVIETRARAGIEG